MQIQPTSAASAAAGNVSQATSKDRTSGGVSEAAQVSVALGVERVARSEATSADRDAQGGGQGLDTRGEHHSHPDPGTHGVDSPSGLPVLSPETASELDIVG